nr:hypothetical protein [Tanacetum cinerariifolium]
MKRVGKGFSGVETPLFEGLMVGQEIKEEGDADEHVEEVTAVQEVVDVVTTAKLIAKVVTAVSKTITAASAITPTVEPKVPAATLTAAPARLAAAPSRRRKEVTKEQIKEEENRALQSINETPSEKAAKRRKLNKEVEDLKRHLEIMSDEDDDLDPNLVLELDGGCIQPSLKLALLMLLSCKS